MTEPAHISLLDEMDAAVDALRKYNPNLHDALGDDARVNVPEPKFKCPGGEEARQSRRSGRDGNSSAALPGGEGCALEVIRLDLIPGSQGRHHAPRAGHCP